MIVAFGTSPAAAFGLSDNFLQAVVWEAIKVVAGYIPALLAVVAIYQLAKRRFNWSACGLAAIAVLIFIGYPMWSTREYSSEHTAILNRATFPEQLYLRGRTVLYVDTSCFDDCELLRTHGGFASVHFLSITWKDRGQYSMFNGPIDLTQLQGVRSVDLTIKDNVYPKRERIDLQPTEAVSYDYIIFGDSIAPLGEALLRWYPDGAQIRPDALVVGLAYIPVEDPKAFDLGMSQPDVFIPYHSAHYYSGIYNPTVRRNADNSEFYTQTSEVNRLICRASAEPADCDE
jgi:hypothetical protein